MSAHLINGEFQSDKYPTCPRGKVPLSVRDPTAQDLLWQYAQRRREVDTEFSDDLETALRLAGFEPDLIETIEDLRGKLAESEAECFSLAANLCHDGYGDDGGSHRCRYQDKLADARNDALREAATKFRRDSWPLPLSDYHRGRDDAAIILNSLLTTPDRSAQRQAVIDAAYAWVEISTRESSFEPKAEEWEVLDIDLQEAVQALQSPPAAKEE